MDTENEKVGSHSWEERNGELLFNEYVFLFWEDDNVLEIDGGDDYTTM